ncbi:MAG: hypothetical protein ABIA76_00695 [Candidatus Diapherotrites archaeon]
MILRITKAVQNLWNRTFNKPINWVEFHAKRTDGWFQTAKNMSENHEKFIQAFKPKKASESFSIEMINTKHESDYALALIPAQAIDFTESMLPQLKLGMDKKSRSIIVEAIQCSEKELAKKINEELGQKGPWANFLLRELEDYSKKNRYAQIKIRKPETLHNYHKPIIALPEKERRKVYRRPKGIISRLKKAEESSGKKNKKVGLSQEEAEALNGNETIKKFITARKEENQTHFELDPKVMNEYKSENKLENALLVLIYSHAEEKRRKAVQESMRKLYYGTARGCNYTEERDYFVKEL